MRVLHIEHRVITALRGHLVEVEFHLRVGLAGQHGEADRVLADLFQQVAQCHEGTGPLGHAHRLTGAQHVHDLAQHRLQPRFAVRHGLHRRIQAGHVTAVIGAEHVDQQPGAARHLVGVIGDVVGEIGVRAIGLAQRPVDVVAEPRGPEQRLRARLPVFRQLALGRVEGPFIDQSFRAQPLDQRIRGAVMKQRAFGAEHRMLDAERVQIGADISHHSVDGEVAHSVDPELRRGDAEIGLGERGAVGGGKQLADRDQILAAVLQSAGNLVVKLRLGERRADRLQVAPIGGPGQCADLGAGVVDVVFLGDGVTGLGHQVGQRIAHHGAAAMADMHRAGGICGDVFDIDRQAGAGRAVAEGLAGTQDRREQGAQGVGHEAQVHESGPGGGGVGEFGGDAELFHQCRGDPGRGLTRRLGRDQGGVGRHVAMRRVARRCDLHARGDVVRQVGGDVAQCGQDTGADLVEQVGHARGGGAMISKGSRTGTPSGPKCFVFRVRTIIPRVSAVAAIAMSAKPGFWPAALAVSVMMPAFRAVPVSRGRIRSPYKVNRRPNQSRRSSARRSAPVRRRRWMPDSISTTDTAERNRQSACRSNQAADSEGIAGLPGAKALTMLVSSR